MTDWNAIKAEYISGNTSYRKIAAKYGVSFATVRSRAEREGWSQAKQKVQHRIEQETAQKVASAAASNVATAERIREKLLRKLEKEIDALPDSIGSQTQKAVIDNMYEGEKSKRIKQIKEARQEYNLRDLTTAYMNLTKDMDLTGNSEQVRIIIDV